MKIALDARGAVWFRGTGIGTYTYQLVRGLTREPVHEFTFFLPAGFEDGLPGAADANWVTVRENPDWHVEQAQMVRAMEKAGIGLYHMPQNGLNLPRYLPFPVVVTLHDVIPYILPQTCNPAFRRRFMEQMPYIAERADMLITVFIIPAGTLSAICRSSRKDRCHLCRPGAHLCASASDSCREFLWERYGIASEPLILYVGIQLAEECGALVRPLPKLRRNWDRRRCW